MCGCIHHQENILTLTSVTSLAVCSFVTLKTLFPGLCSLILIAVISLISRILVIHSCSDYYMHKKCDHEQLRLCFSSSRSLPATQLNCKRFALIIHWSTLILHLQCTGSGSDLLTFTNFCQVWQRERRFFIVSANRPLCNDNQNE